MDIVNKNIDEMLYLATIDSAAAKKKRDLIISIFMPS